MIGGYTDLRNHARELIGGAVTEGDIDLAVRALAEEAGTTEMTALGAFNELARAQAGRRHVLGSLSGWSAAARDRGDDKAARQADGARARLEAAFAGTSAQSDDGV